MIKDSPNPPSNSSAFQAAAHRAINHYLNSPKNTEQPAPNHGLFAVRDDVDAETLLVNASEDLASAQALASHLAFEIDGASRSVALGICRMLEGIELLVDRALDQYPLPAQR